MVADYVGGHIAARAQLIASSLFAINLSADFDIYELLIFCLLSGCPLTVTANEMVTNTNSAGTFMIILRPIVATV